MLDALPVMPDTEREDAPVFNTDRFIVAPLNPAKLRELAHVLLQDGQLAEQIPWMADKTEGGAAREAFLLEMQCAAGTTRAWGIVDPRRAMFIGAVLARQTLAGLDVEILCASRFWNQGVADEVGPPVTDWLEDHAEIEIVLPN